MGKLVTNNVTGGYADVTAINDNNALIETAVENTLSRDGTTPNSMSADFDMDGNDILNAGTVNTVAVQIGGVSVVPGDTLSVATAANVPNVPAGNIAATDLQGAINELDGEKLTLIPTPVTNDLVLQAADGELAKAGFALPNVNADVTASDEELNILDGATLSTTELNYVDGVTSDVQTQLDGKAIGMLAITGSVATSALTAGLNATVLTFRNATLTSGVPTTVTVGSALSVVVPSGATLGTVSTIQSRIILLAINNAGTVELAVVNESGGVSLSEEGVVSTTAIDATADSNNVIYSTTARSNVAYRVVGVVESTQATAGTWATAPTVLQGVGGGALAAMSSLGKGQTWQDVVGSRAISTTYYNTTGKPIFVNVWMQRTTNTAGYLDATLSVDGVDVDHGRMNMATEINSITVGAIVPSGSYYSVAYTGVPDTLYWKELR